MLYIDLLGFDLHSMPEINTKVGVTEKSRNKHSVKPDLAEVCDNFRLFMLLLQNMTEAPSCCLKKVTTPVSNPKPDVQILAYDQHCKAALQTQQSSMSSLHKHHWKIKCQ